jgi:hypothetical protein
VLKRLFTRRNGVTVALMVGALSLGIAFATWTATGAGSGTARAATAVVSVVTGRNGTPDLYPGFTDGDVSFTVTNPNPYPVRYTSASFGTVTSSDPTNCPSANVTTDASVSGLTIDVPAGSTGTDASIPDVVNMSSSAPNACQGVNFTITLSLSGTQQ